MTPSQRLQKLGIILPEAPAAVASYIPGVLDGELLYVSGQLPFVSGELIARGPVPVETNETAAVACARQCAVNGLAVAAAVLGSVDRIERVVRLGGFVACGPGYADQPKIINGASELLGEVFGEAGRHARAAVGVSSLPLNAPVEIEFLFRVRAD